ncbi:WxL domain-containing protein, partial [Enterococcus thailandicus]|uniref:WxL domain-containing protein n=1 Tax=Enterococcus thailandicus TaxID=417368 RepID=UPI0021174364
TDPTDPVDPTDPTDPEGPNPGTNGPLSIDYASSLDFGVQKITSKDQIYFAASQKYK